MHFQRAALGNDTQMSFQTTTFLKRRWAIQHSQDTPSTQKPNQNTIYRCKFNIVNLLSPADAVNEPWVGTRDYSCNIYTNDKETFPEAYWGSIFISSAVDPYKPELDIKL